MTYIEIIRRALQVVWTASLLYYNSEFRDIPKLRIESPMYLCNILSTFLCRKVGLLEYDDDALAIHTADTYINIILKKMVQIKTSNLRLKAWWKYLILKGRGLFQDLANLFHIQNGNTNTKINDTLSVHRLSLLI